MDNNLRRRPGMPVSPNPQLDATRMLPNRMARWDRTQRIRPIGTEAVLSRFRVSGPAAGTGEAGLHVGEGARRRPLPVGQHDFVLNRRGSMYAVSAALDAGAGAAVTQQIASGAVAPARTRPYIGHVHLTGGLPVQLAGSMEVAGGDAAGSRITHVIRDSGHYRPTAGRTYLAALGGLRRRGLLSDATEYQSDARPSNTSNWRNRAAMTFAQVGNIPAPAVAAPAAGRAAPLAARVRMAAPIAAPARRRAVAAPLAAAARGAAARPGRALVPVAGPAVPARAARAALPALPPRRAAVVAPPAVVAVGGGAGGIRAIRAAGVRQAPVAAPGGGAPVRRWR